MENADDFVVPEHLEPGAYANALRVWRTRHELTIDFGVLPFDQDDDASVVSRMRLAPTFAFEVIERISRGLEDYVAEWGA